MLVNWNHYSWPTWKVWLPTFRKEWLDTVIKHSSQTLALYTDSMEEKRMTILQNSYISSASYFNKSSSVVEHITDYLVVDFLF